MRLKYFYSLPNTFKKILTILCHPFYWFSFPDRLNPYCKEFDKWILEKIDEGNVPKYKSGSDCVVLFANRTFWCYISSTSRYSLYEDGYDSVSPSITTKIKLDKLLKKHSKDENVIKKKYNWRKE